MRREWGVQGVDNNREARLKRNSLRQLLYHLLLSQSVTLDYERPCYIAAESQLGAP